MIHESKVLDVLLIEDDASDIRIFKDLMLECSGCWRLHVVSDGEEAMQYLNHQGVYANVPRPNLILLDLNMPKKDGREVLSEIKIDPILSSIPVVILTTSSADRDIQAAYKLHASSFITKPRERKEFISIIKVLDHFWSKIATTPHR